MRAWRSVALSAKSPCISPSTSSQGAVWCSMAKARRILSAVGWLDEPKLECDSSAALGVMPKRCISCAAMMVYSAICSALGS